MVLVGRRCPRSPSLRPLPSFPKYPQNPNFVIPRAVAESIFACQHLSQRIQSHLHTTMDTATSRSMTVRGLPPLRTSVAKSKVLQNTSL